MIRPRDVSLFLFAALVLAGVAACRRTSGYERFVPSVERAEEALGEVLAAWQRGEPVGPLDLQSAPIKIEVADSTRKPGQWLVGYELLGEVSGEGPRTFVVRLKLDTPQEEQEVRYYLVGVDPLWVMRQQDYDAVVHWDVCEDPNAADRQNPASSTARIR